MPFLDGSILHYLLSCGLCCSLNQSQLSGLLAFLFVISGRADVVIGLNGALDGLGFSGRRLPQNESRAASSKTHFSHLLFCSEVLAQVYRFGLVVGRDLKRKEIGVWTRRLLKGLFQVFGRLNL